MAGLYFIDFDEIGNSHIFHLIMRSIILIISLLVVFSSCEKKLTYSITEKKINETLIISINSDFNPDIRRVQYIKSDSGEYLAIKNKSKPEIILFDLQTKKINYKIPLFTDGPNSIGNYSGFQIYKPDCVLISSIPPKAFSINFQGEVLASTPIFDPENKVNYVGSTNETPFIVKDKELWGAQPFYSNIFNITEKEAINTLSIFKIEANKTDTVSRWIPISRPPNIWSDGKKSANFAWANRHDSIIVAPFTDHRLWVISKKGERLVSYVNVKSESVNSFRVIDGYPAPGDKGIIQDLESDSYENFIYDIYRDVFYRFFLPKIDVNDYNLSPRSIFSRRPMIGVMVLDKDLKILGEFNFLNHEIENRNYFVGKKGLYVSTNNPNRDDFDENILRYDIIRFEGLNYED